MTMSVLLIRPIDEALFKIYFAASGRVSISKLRIGSGSMGTVGFTFPGGQGESGFESKMSSYIFFSKDVLHVGRIRILQIFR